MELSLDKDLADYGPLPLIKMRGEFDTPQSRILYDSYLRAYQGDSSLPDWIALMDGMSGRKFRYLLNNLVALTPAAAYLEIGSWAGSTACAAMSANPAKIVCVDNWAWFGAPKDLFIENTDRCRNDAIDFTLVEADYQTVDYARYGPFNIYFYDGPHSDEETCFGITVAQNALQPVYTLILDDWNWPHVRAGTCKALSDLNIVLNSYIEIRTTLDGTLPILRRQKSAWHNGLFLGVCQKPLGR